VAAWVDLDSVDTNGANIINIGNAVIIGFNTSGHVTGTYHNSTTWKSLVDLSSPVDYRGAGKIHVLYVVNPIGTSQILYINGISVATGTETGSISWSGGGRTSTTRVGIHVSSGNWDLNGRIGEVALWSAGLGPNMALALGKGIRTFSIRPGALNCYLPMHGFQSPEPDLSGKGRSFTVTGSPTRANHPQIVPYLFNWAAGTVPLIEVAGGTTRILVAVPAAFSVVTAARSMGVVTKALAAIGSAYSIVGATRSMGTKTITPTIPSAAFSVVALTMLRTITASIVSAAYSVVPSVRSMGTKTITPTIPSATFSIVTATAINAILRTVASVSAAFSTVAPSRVMGTATRTVSAVSATFSVVTATAVNAILRVVATVSAAFSIVAPSRVMGTATRAASVVSAAFSAVSVTTQLGAIVRFFLSSIISFRARVSGTQDTKAKVSGKAEINKP